MILSDHAVSRITETHHNVAQGPVVHILAALPDDSFGIDIQFIALLDVVVQHGCQEIIGRRDRMKIAREMKI